MIVQGAYFDHKGETPGLGANIKQRYFMDDFIGEHLLSASEILKELELPKVTMIQRMKIKQITK